MIFFLLSFILLIFFGIILSFLLKLNIFLWNNLWEKENYEVQLPKIQILAFLFFLIFFILNIFFMPQNYHSKYYIFVLILFLVLIYIFLFVSEQFILKLLSKIRFVFVFFDEIIPSKKSKKMEDEDISEKDRKIYIDMGMEQGILEEKEGIMLENLFDFSETLVKEIMTPRTDMVVTTLNSTYDEIKETFIESNFSRLPVIEDSLDNIKGILFLKDLFKVENPKYFDIQQIIRPAHFVPEMKRVQDLLKEMQENHLTISIVMDEYGGTSGIVTMEDLLEELIGEIEDEHTIPDIITMSKDTFSIAGKTHIEAVEDLLKIEIEKGDYDTIAGFLIHLFGTIPEENQEVSYKEHIFKIETADKRRIYRVLVKKYGK